MRRQFHNRGATAVEYLVMLILAAMVIMAIIKVFGSTVEQKFLAANDVLDGTLASESAQANAGNGASGANGNGKSGAGANGKGGANGKNGKNGGGANGKGANGGANANGGNGSDENGANGGGGSGKGKKNGANGQISDDDQTPQAGEAVFRPDKIEKEESGINPLVILIAMALLGLLFYVMSQKKG